MFAYLMVTSSSTSLLQVKYTFFLDTLILKSFVYVISFDTINYYYNSSILFLSKMIICIITLIPSILLQNNVIFVHSNG